MVAKRAPTPLHGRWDLILIKSGRENQQTSKKFCAHLFTMVDLKFKRTPGEKYLREAFGRDPFTLMPFAQKSPKDHGSKSNLELGGGVSGE